MVTQEQPSPRAAQPRRPRVLLAASGSVAAIKFEIICRSLAEWADVRAVATASSLHFIDRESFPSGVALLTDADEWSTWGRISDEVLHIELRKWADAMLIAPLSANTLAKIAGGLCDNLLTCVVRAWDYSKPIYVAPAMNTFMWDNPFTRRHVDVVAGLGHGRARRDLQDPQALLRFTRSTLNTLQLAQVLQYLPLSVCLLYEIGVSANTSSIERLQCDPRLWYVSRHPFRDTNHREP